MTDWFPAKAGVRQGNSLSPILFALCINDMAKDLNELDLHVDIGERKLAILMYADDVVTLAGEHRAAQSQLDVMTRWCNTWGMIPNIKTPMSKVWTVADIGWQIISCIIDLYIVCSLFNKNEETVSNQIKSKLWTMWLLISTWGAVNEHGKYDKTMEALTLAAGRSYGRIVGLRKQLSNLGYRALQHYMRPMFWLWPITSPGCGASEIIQPPRYFESTRIIGIT